MPILAALSKGNTMRRETWARDPHTSIQGNLWEACSRARSSGIGVGTTKGWQNGFGWPEKRGF
jgi:hypothetical protein